MVRTRFGNPFCLGDAWRAEGHQPYHCGFLTLDGSSPASEEPQMYRHILIAIDGSEASPVVIEHGVALATALGAHVTGLHAVPDFIPPAGSPFHLYAFPSREKYMRLVKSVADGVLRAISDACAVAGVSCDLTYGVESRPHALILAMAVEHGCDLICMGSHGRGGLGSLLLGSQTQKVLAHGTLPVLVVRLVFSNEQSSEQHVSPSVTVPR